MGSVEFSARALKELISMKVNVGVCTLSSSRVNSDHVDLSAIAHQAGIPVRLALDINSDDVLDEDHAPDII